MNQIVNTFARMQEVGAADAASDNAAAREIRNFRLVQREGGSWVLVSVAGTAHVLDLPAGFRVHGHAVHGPVAYLVLFNPGTGEGELGSFPSPDGTGALTDAYRALRNFLPAVTAEEKLRRLVAGLPEEDIFRSTRFAFRADRPVEVLVQPDYDGSVNLVLNDAHNPPLLVNTGFAVGPQGEVSFPDRAGERESNRYGPLDFGGRLQLIQRSTRLLRVDFRGVRGGGRQKAGTYHYYFRYGTEDGNTTELAAESMPVMVAHGDRPGNTRGGAGDGEDTDKATHFRLSHVDRSYSRVHVFFVHTTGTTDPVRTAYRLEQPLRVTGAEIDFVHTGFEDVQRIDIQELSVEAPSVARAGAIAQAQGHLFLADVTETERDWDLLRAFSRRLTLGHYQAPVPLPGLGDTAGLFAAANDQDTAPAGWGWNNGYANPMNTYHRMGYFGGEAYPFGARYIFPDGSVSPAFPFTGADQALNNVPASALKSPGGFDADGLSVAHRSKMVNDRGIFRFPLRNAPFTTGGPAIAPLVVGGAANVFAATVELPDFSDAQYAEIRRQTVGIQFLRGERRPDLLAQGLAVQGYSVPSLDMESSVVGEAIDRTLYGWFNTYTGSQVHNGVYSEDYLTGDKRRVVPLVHGELEGAYWREGGNDPEYGAFPVRLWEGFADPERYGLYSLDLAHDHARLAAALNSREVDIHFLQTAFHQHAAYHTQAKRETVHAPTLHLLTHMAQLQRAPLAGTSFYVPDGEAGVLATNNRFGSYIGKLALQDPGSENTDYVKAEGLFFADYLGLYLPGAARNASMVVQQPSGSIPDAERLFAKQAAPVGGTVLVNLYPAGGMRSREAVWQVYRNTDAGRYTPVSPRLYWDADTPGADPLNTLEGQLQGRKAVLFGGDCFIGTGFKKIYHGARRPIPVEDDADKVGRGIQLVQETAYNPYLRVEERVDATEADARSFFPFYRHAGGDRRAFFRDNKAPETKAANAGYAKTFGDLTLLTRPLDAPFLRSRWFSRVLASAQHIPNSFENGYRRFPGGSHQDYSSEYGAITALRAKGGALMAFFERAIGVIAVNERVQTGRDTAGAIFVEGGGLLPAYMGMVTEAFGAAHWQAVALTDDFAYVAVPEKGLIARMAFGSDRADIVSRLRLGPWLEKHVRGLAPLAFRDPANGEVLFAFRGPTHRYTVAFHEELDLWTGHRDFAPHAAFALADDRLFSTAWDAPGSLHEHHVGPHGHFYGQPFDAVVRFVSNPGAGREVTFTTQGVDSSNALPALAHYRVAGAAATLEVLDTPDPVLRNARRVRGVTFLTLPLAQRLTAEATEPWLPAGEDTQAAGFDAGARLRGKQLQSELRFPAGRQAALTAVITYFQ